MSIYYDYGKRKSRRKTNDGANEQFAQIVKDTITHPYNVQPPPPLGTEESLREQWKNERLSARYESGVEAGKHYDLLNRPNQANLENEQKTVLPQREKRGIPFLVKMFAALAVFMLAGSTGNDVILFIVGVSIFSWLFL